MACCLLELPQLKTGLKVQTGYVGWRTAGHQLGEVFPLDGTSRPALLHRGLVCCITVPDEREA